jgi:hypothetical protein
LDTFDFKKCPLNVHVIGIEVLDWAVQVDLLWKKREKGSSGGRKEEINLREELEAQGVEETIHILNARVAVMGGA